MEIIVLEWSYMDLSTCKYPSAIDNLASFEPALFNPGWFTTLETANASSLKYFRIVWKSLAYNKLVLTDPLKPPQDNWTYFERGLAVIVRTLSILGSFKALVHNFVVRKFEFSIAMIVYLLMELFLFFFGLLMRLLVLRLRDHDEVSSDLFDFVFERNHRFLCLV